MAQYEDEDFDLDEDNPNDSALLKQLRKQLKSLAKERDDAKAEWEKERKALTDYRVRDVLKDKGISDQRASKYLVADGVDLADEGQVTKWLEENGDMFGYRPQEPEKEQQFADALSSMGNAEQQGTAPGRAHEGLNAIENTKSEDDVVNLLLGKYGNVTVLD